MNHPTREEWMSFLHDETNGAEGRALQQHLGECAECRAQVNAWQVTRRRLDTWKIAPPQPPRSFQFAWPRLATAAAAAMVLLAAGLAIGRVTSPSRTELASLHAEVQALKSGLNTSLESAVGTETRQQLLDFANDVNARIAVLQAQQATLRRELETVAVLTEAGFKQTESRFVQLASSNPPEANE